MAALAATAIATGPAGGEGVPRFTDVAPRSRIAYRSNNGFTGRKYFPQPMCGGVAVFDFDGDGRYDIFFTNGSKLPELRKVDPSLFNCLLRNKGDGTFEDVTACAGLQGAHLDFSFGVAAGDCGDGTFAQEAAAWNIDYNDQGTTISGMGAEPRTTTPTAGSTSSARPC